MKLNFTENDIFEAEFKTSFRGYDKDEVNDFLDKIIEDYIAFQEMLEKMQESEPKVQPQEVMTEAGVNKESEEELTLDFVRPKSKNITDEVPPLSSLFNFDTEDEGEDVEDLLTVSDKKKTVVESTNYDLIQRLAQLEKEVASLRDKK